MLLWSVVGYITHQFSDCSLFSLLHVFLVSFIFCFFFFFFKQKTAYEMRISDWSSDVCSSDLRHAQPRRTGQGGVEGRISLAQAEIDILGTQGAHQAAQQRELFSGSVFSRQSADLAAAMTVAHPRQALRHGLQRVDRKSTRLNSSH